MLVDDIRKGITMRLSVVESVEETTRLYDIEPPLKVATTRYTLQTLFTHRYGGVLTCRESHYYLAPSDLITRQCTPISC
jgi:hypothetical protein